MRKRLKWIILLAIILAAGVMLTLAVMNTLTEEGAVFKEGVVSSETVTVLIILVISVPALLIILLLVLLFSKEKQQTVVATVDGSVPQKPAEKKESEEEEETVETQRFCMLSKIDENKHGYGHVSYGKSISLCELCEDFRNYAAREKGLYYDISDIRRFISGLAVSHIIILQGMSGTGKTSLADVFGKYIDNPSTIISVQPMWKERTDLLGYYNEFTRKFNETQLLKKMYEAHYSNDIYITVLDEMNIARVEYYFAEFLSILELPDSERRDLDVVSDEWATDPQLLKEGKLKIPDNMWFIGTANNDDSTFAISDKVYDRAMILNLDAKSERFIAPKTEKRPISYEQFVQLCKEAVEEYGISQRNMKRLKALDQYLIDNFHITFGNRIMGQIMRYIPVFLSCGGDELDALDDILAKKVIRKLETQNPIYLRKAAEGLIEYISELFGNDKMPLCKEYIHRLERNA